MDYEKIESGADGPMRDDGVELNQTTDYRLNYGDGGLTFRQLVFADPVPVGRQILEHAGVRDVEQYALIALLPSGAMEDIRLDEPMDLRGRGIERVVAFRTDVLQRAFLLGRDMLWGRPDISGHDLYALADLAEGEALYIDVPGGTDIPVPRDGMVDLAKPGVERFVAGPPHPPAGFDIAVSYNGIVRTVRVTPGETIAALIETVRPQFGNPGGDLVLVDAASGRVLEPTHTIAQEGVQPGAHLQLRPRTVQGG